MTTSPRRALRPVQTTLAILALACASAGCRSHIESQLTVNNAPFRPTSCRSGQVYGFAGVELTDASGARVRFAATPSGEALAYYLPPGAPMGASLGTCGSMTVTPENSTINNVRNVRGNANVVCSNGAVAIAGTVTFANCH